jgi:monooxygenase
MSATAPLPQASEHEHHDVLIIGAGLSGIGAAVHLQRELPGKSYAILEARDAIGGTWDLFRYPGIRSDSDMFTLGYSFKPWKHERMIADGWTIRDYIQETAREYGIDRNIRFGHKVVRVDWDSKLALWTVTAELLENGDTVKLTANFIHVCGGYYRYDEGFTPDFPGIENFGGTVIHPQHWPEDLDYTGKRVVVIGSGATAMTLVPAMSDRAAQVTMLQRSPSYVVSLPGIDPVAQVLRKLLPSSVAYGVVRAKQLGITMASFQFFRRLPKQARAALRQMAIRQLPEGYEVDTHFKPKYDPWDERLCVVPDGDLFRALRSGKAAIVTDRIESFTETGIKLASGNELEADIVVTATGLQLQVAGGAGLFVDGNEVDFSQTVAYKGLMYSGIPNAAVTFGYTNASWTLKADLIASYVCRLLKYMDDHGYDYVMPLAPPPDVPLRPFLDLQSGYIQRASGILPKQADRAPWRVYQNYILDYRLLKYAPVADEGVQFGRVAARSGAAEASEAPELVA